MEPKHVRLESLTDCSTATVLARALQCYFRGNQYVKRIDSHELLFDASITVPIEGPIPFKTIDIPVQQNVSISCAADAIKSCNRYEIANSESFPSMIPVIVKVDNAVVFSGKKADAAAKVCELLYADANAHPLASFEPVALLTLKEIIADATLPGEMIMAAHLLNGLIDPDCPCVYVVVQDSYYKMAFRNPAVFYRGVTKQLTSTHAFRRNHDGTFDVSQFLPKTKTEIFHNIEAIRILSSAVSLLWSNIESLCDK
jgi:hypothetical protein